MRNPKCQKLEIQVSGKCSYADIFKQQMRWQETKELSSKKYRGAGFF